MSKIEKVVKDFFGAIIGKEVTFTNVVDLYAFEVIAMSQIGGKRDIAVKARRLLNYRYSYWVCIPGGGGDANLRWLELEVRDNAVVYNESTGESTNSWQIEPLRYSEMMAIKHQLELHKEGKISLSDVETIYVLGPSKKLDDLSAKISYGL